MRVTVGKNYDYYVKAIFLGEARVPKISQQNGIGVNQQYTRPLKPLPRMHNQTAYVSQKEAEIESNTDQGFKTEITKD